MVHFKIYVSVIRFLEHSELRDTA